MFVDDTMLYAENLKCAQKETCQNKRIQQCRNIQSQHRKINCISCFLICFEREKERERDRKRESMRAKEGQRGRENPNQDPGCWCRAPHGAQSHKPRDRDLSQDQESDAQPNEPPDTTQLHFCIYNEQSKREIKKTIPFTIDRKE